MGKDQETEEGEEGDWEEAVSDVKRAAIYVRVSTVDQETDLQEAELLEYCQRRGWTPILYRDHGQSGAKQDRPALTALLNDLRKRKIDVILIWSLDRLARSLRHLLAISEECRLMGVDLVSLRQNIDTRPRTGFPGHTGHRKYKREEGWPSIMQSPFRIENSTKSERRL